MRRSPVAAALVALLGAACLDESDVRVRQGFNMAVKAGNLAAVDRMLAVDPSLAAEPWRWRRDSSDYVEDYPFLTAVAAGQVEVAQRLLDGGASIETNEGGGTALLIAARQHKPELVRLLLERGASMQVRDSDRLDPLDWAVLESDARTVALLCAFGAGPSSRSSSRLPDLTRFVGKNGGCAALPAVWKATPPEQRSAWLAAQACRLDPYACPKEAR